MSLWMLSVCLVAVAAGCGEGLRKVLRTLLRDGVDAEVVSGAVCVLDLIDCADGERDCVGPCLWCGDRCLHGGLLLLLDGGIGRCCGV